MNINANDLELKIYTIVQSVIDQLKRVNEFRPRIEAICQPIDKDDMTFPAYNKDDRLTRINLGSDFHELETRDQLLYINGVIQCHIFVTEGVIEGLGEIMYYEFTRYENEEPVLFGRNGKLMI